MTLDEYASEIADKIRAAYNAKDGAAARSAISEAETNLLVSNVNALERQRFWTAVRQRFPLGQMLVEKQEASSLHQLMREIQLELEARSRDAGRDI